MIAALYNRYTYLRVATSLILTLMIGFKVVAPVFAKAPAMSKETSAINDDDPDNNAEKKAENNSSLEKEKEFASIYSDDQSHTMWHIPVVHSTAYHINYLSSYYSKITIPPPDFCLHTSV